MGHCSGWGAAVTREDRHRQSLTLVLLVLVLALGIGVAVPAFAADAPRGTRVVGGTAVPDGKYPFMVHLRNDAPGVENDLACGGTLIGQTHVLTAAHCSMGSASQLRLVVGRTVLSSTQGQVRRASAVYLHPRYSAGSGAYDVAVVKLNSPVSGIAPIKLDPVGSDAYEAAGLTVRVAGWGATGTGYPAQEDRMREARPPIVSDAAAKSAYGAAYVSSLMVAAGKEGVDTCQGDSGGPLFVPVSGGYRQIGVTSYGDGCARAGYPGVYAELSSASIGNFVREAQTR